MSRNMSRRKFLKISLSAGAGIAAMSKGLPLAAQDMMYSEAPELAELVAAGDLPAVADRLPVNPVVVEPLDSIGEYGGAIRTGIFQNRGFQARSAWGPEPILRIGWDSSTIEPNIAESWEYTNGGNTFVLHLREGMKWSDGAPFGAHDFEFYWNHVLSNSTLSPSPRSEFVINGELAEFEVVDDLTVQWTFAAPHANLPGLLSHWIGSQLPRWMPRHYLEQFHPDFADAADLESKIAEAGFSTWDELFNNRVAVQYGLHFDNVDLPNLLPFKTSRPMELNIVVADRNPYYWKVDPEGHQLPYINQVILTNYEGADVRDAAIAAGEMNWVNTDLTFTNFPLYQENAEAGNYEVRLWQTSRSAEHTIMFNHNAKDEGLREIFNDVRFKQAMSMAIDRQTIANVVYQGFGVPSQVQVIPGSKFRVEEYVTRHTEYDTAAAAALLDEMGLTAGDDGMRAHADGSALSIRMDISIGQPGSEDVGELLREFLAEVGVDLDVRVVAREQIRALIDNNDIECGIWIADKCSDSMFPHTPVWHVPFLPTDWNQWGPQYAVHYASGGDSGEAPMGDVAQVQQLFDQMKTTIDEAERVNIGQEIMRLNIDNLWNIGDVGEVPIPVVLGANFRNYPAQGFTSFDWLGNHQYHIEQCYFEGGDWVGAPN